MSADQDTRELKTSDFDYDLPPECIAQDPPAERGLSRMLVLHRGSGRMEDRGVAELPAFLRAGDLLVVNDTRVLTARLAGKWADTGGNVELLLLEPRGPAEWEAMIGARRRIHDGLRMLLPSGCEAVVGGNCGDGRFVVRLDGPLPAVELMEQAGAIPLPPYIRRAEGDARDTMDRERYQTMFARSPGAVAAPTAGLHFNAALLGQLERSGVECARITLHVGPGTFRPVKADRVLDHVMDAERYDVSPEAAEAVNGCRARGGRVVAVGSTTVRTLETVGGADGIVRAGTGRTSLFIRPPHRFTVVNAMLTNFHLPRSTLIMMVAAFAEAAEAGGPGRSGRELVLAAYRHAVASGYRFYSYGDCMLLL